ncbi:MAG TPA: sigma-70 family RNA polymerase sigma factor [Solirubrobacteraceae bacterium]|nr:sigma-70 family RNA polymerase sigma factor [Solirubrobacteraceae bacterium]
MDLPPFQDLLDRHGREVHRFLIATVGAAEADDAYQETWLAALRAYPRLRDATNLKGWLFTIAHRKALDHFRRRGRVAVPAGELPERSVEDAHREEGDLWALVRRLPHKQRTAVALRYVLDADYALISTAMGTSQEAARRNVFEGLKRLRLEYE